MFKRYFKQILCFLLLISIFIFGFKQYYDKRMYEEFISHIITNNSQELIQGIVQTHAIYDEILESNQLSSQQLNLLSIYITNSLQVFQYNLGLAQQFGLYNDNDDTEKILGDLQEIEQFYSRLLIEKELDEKIIEIEPSLKNKLTYIKDLNKLWLDSIYTNYDEVTIHGDKFEFNTIKFQKQHGNRIISTRFWLDLLIDLSSIHKDYLLKNDLYSISEVLN